MRNLLFLLIAIAIVGCTFANDHPTHLRRRLSVEKSQGFHVMTKQHLRRRLKSFQTGKWRRPKIYFDLRKLNTENPSRAAFYKKVFLIVKAFWEQAVWINDSVSEKDNLIQQIVEQKLIPQPQGKGWKKYDLYVTVHMAPTDGGTLAWAGPLYRHPKSQRPITGDCGITKFGDKNMLDASDSVNRAAGTMIHEFGHVMAYISYNEYHKHYTHWSTSRQSWEWTGPVTKRNAAKYYGCSASEMHGILLQTMADKTVGGHVSEPIFSDELMTPFSGSEPEKVSPIMLGMAEDTKWYKADYSMVENYDYMKDHPAQCKQDQMCPKDRSCSIGDTDFVTADYRGIGYCQEDQYKCPREKKYGNRDTAKAYKWPKSSLKYGGNFGESSFVVQGRFQKFEGQSFSTTKQVPVTGSCSDAQDSYTILFKGYKYHLSSTSYSGDLILTCTTKGKKVYFNSADENPKGDYSSYVECYDPATFCKARFAKLGAAGLGFKSCDKSCMKNGRCHPGLPKAESMKNRRLVWLNESQIEKLASVYPDSSRTRRRMQTTTTTSTSAPVVTTTSTSTSSNSAKPKVTKKTTKTAAAKPVLKTIRIKKHPKTQSERIQTVTHLSKTKLKASVKTGAKKCVGMSKTNRCGKGHGFCRTGHCSSVTHMCGKTSAYIKYSDKAWVAKAECKTMIDGAQVLKRVNLKIAKKNAFDKKNKQWNEYDTKGSEWGEWTTKDDDSEKPAAESKTPVIPTKVKTVVKKVVKPKVKPPAPTKLIESIPDVRHAGDISEKLNAKDVISLQKKSEEGKWMCWCYSDYKQHRTCPDLIEDKD
jgi:hypothetical protein